ncbi:amidase family protein [Actinokineospora inagensis]|uniref:amidase family protein n=1 Tax=Actinokineospora inagensis TaxID=103730 RepID=UPI001B7F7B06|nr:amidase family protein [Actinokineospora inagensis]
MELWEMPAWRLVDLVRAGAVSAREVVDSHQRRVEQVNPAVNAIVDVPDEVPAGIPVTVKVNIDVAGMASTFGVVRGQPAERDAEHIARVRAAGATVLGRTNMPEFGMRWHTANDIHGPTRNPWDATLTAGGSSGGDAAAVAAGMVPIGLGNDGAGSLRWPAQCCGVAALKPSLGRVPITETAPFAFQLLTTHGPIAREVRDLRMVFEHMVGTPLDGPPLPKRVYLASGLNVDAGIARALHKAAELLIDAGYVVEEHPVPALERAAELHTQIMSRFGRIHDRKTPVETVTSVEFARFWATFEPVWTEAQGEHSVDPMAERAEIARTWDEWMSGTPLVLAPVRTHPAFPVGVDLDPAWLAGFPASMRMAVAVNLLGLPAVALPVDIDGAAPPVVQLIGPRYREDLCLSAAAEIEARQPARVPIDPR